MPQSLRENADRLSERFYLDAPGWYRQSAHVPHLPAVAAAVWDGQVIEIRYRRWKEPAEVVRQIEPYGLVLKAGTRYVVARCDGSFRTYRADQIVDVACCRCGFEPVPDFDLEAHWRGYLADFHQRLHTGHALIRVSPAGLQRMTRLPAAVTVAVRTSGVDGPDGWITARVPIESVGQALGEFLRLGADIEVLEPAELRHQIVQAVRDLVALYDTGRAAR